jgi:hypothetical protein
MRRAIIGDDNGDWRIELAETTQHPVQPLFLIMPLDPHHAENLLGNFDLAFAVSCVDRVVHPEFA